MHRRLKYHGLQQVSDEYSTNSNAGNTTTNCVGTRKHVVYSLLGRKLNKEALKEFGDFVAGEIEPAITEIGGLAENSRKHLQKLVYTNLVDRFDSMIDRLILDNCRNDGLIEAAETDMKNQVTEAELIRLLMESANLESAIDTRFKASIRNTILRLRHSRKLLKLFQIFQPEQQSEKYPRVNVSTGKILEKIKPQQKFKCPYSIMWLCSLAILA